MGEAIKTMALNPVEEAASVLDTYWVKNADGSHVLPIDPFEIARDMSIRVFATELHPSTAGAIRKVQGADAQILVNLRDSPQRQRFTCAHGIGHYVYNTKTNDNSYEYVDRRDTVSSQGTNPNEMWANAFAANLLMPEAAVRSVLREEPNLYSLARRFGACPESMNYRLINLRLSLPTG